MVSATVSEDHCEKEDENGVHSISHSLEIRISIGSAIDERKEKL